MSFKFYSNNPAFAGASTRIWEFWNGYGASVVMFPGSYGSEEGLFELAVIKFREDGTWSIDPNTSITNEIDGVLGFLNEEEVQEILKKIEKL